MGGVEKIEGPGSRVWLVLDSVLAALSGANFGKLSWFMADVPKNLDNAKTLKIFQPLSNIVKFLFGWCAPELALMCLQTLHRFLPCFRGIGPNLGARTIFFGRVSDDVDSTIVSGGGSRYWEMAHNVFESGLMKSVFVFHFGST